MDDKRSLQQLIGTMAISDFFSTIWEKERHIFPQVSRFDWLLRLDELGDMLASKQPDPNAIVTMGQMIDGKYSGYRVSSADGEVDFPNLYRLWQQGYTLIVPAVHSRWQPVDDFTRALARELSGRVETNLYYTPPGAIGFPPHYDTHDVFIVQVHGEKLWHFYPSRTLLPLPQQRYDMNDPQLREDLKQKKSILLKAGDVLYMPRGIVHSAESIGMESLHLSIGLYPVLWLDIARYLLEKQAEKSPLLRRALPPHIAAPEMPEELLAILTSPDTWQQQGRDSTTTN